MKQYRQTYVEVNLKQIEKNISKIIKKYNDYKYYFGVVKADCYGHDTNRVVKSVIKGGCNYLAVSSLEEALQIRKSIKDIPILCIGIILKEYLDICCENNITVTIPSLEYAMEIPKKLSKKLKCHIKIDTGMNRIGIKNKDELEYTYHILKERGFNIEGLFTHIYDASNSRKSKKQFQVFEKLTENIPLNDIPIIHLAQSETLTNYPMLPYVNGCRLGIIMYGFTNDETLDLKSTFSLKSQVIQIKELKKNETVGYGGVYKAKNDEIIGIVAIGYADGIIRKNTGRYVYINNREYKIIGNICMDMLMIKIDEYVSLYDEVEIIKDIEHMNTIAKHLNTIPYEIMCNITKRVPRKYIRK